MIHIQLAANWPTKRESSAEWTNQRPMCPERLTKPPNNKYNMSLRIRRRQEGRAQ
jgi:hypothetical protein